MNVKEYRFAVGAEILILMNKNKDLPLPNKNRVAKVMQEYFNREGYQDDIREQGWRWKAGVDYWYRHLKDIAAYLREEKRLYFDYPRPWGSLEGEWKFVNKREYEELLERGYSDIKTRTETYNGKLDSSKWDLELPHIADIPLLTSN